MLIEWRRNFNASMLLWSMTMAGRNQIIYQLNYWQTLRCRALDAKGFDVPKNCAPSTHFLHCVASLLSILQNCQMIDYIGNRESFVRVLCPLRCVWQLCFDDLLVYCQQSLFCPQDHHFPHSPKDRAQYSHNPCQRTTICVDKRTIARNPF